MKLLLILLSISGAAFGAILPDTIGPYHRASTTQPALTDRPLWDELGLKESESAAYQDGSHHFTATVYRLQDSTGALAAFDWQRPPNSKPSGLAKLAAETPDSLLAVHGNYLVSLAGHKPDAAEWTALTEALHHADPTPLPVLPAYLPADALVPNSERYVVGPVCLEKFGSGIPPSVAGFHFGAEAQLGTYHGPKGDLRLAIFNYPTHQIAMQKTAEFEKLPGAVVKRTGPLIAVVLSPPDPDFAERLLGSIRYQAEVTRDEYVPTHRDNIGWVVISIFILIGILIAASFVSGLAWGAVRAFLRHGRKGEDADAMISLHLGGR